MADQRKESNQYEEEMELRRGPWTLEEDTLLIHYIASHGEGRWNHLARCSGLKRTGKSCRLRWLNYLKPDIKRGNLSPEEQFLILELHSKWGNRWSRIAQHLPGRTDNEIKNYWRTRVQKQARQLKMDTNSNVFRDAVRCHWMPRLIEMMGSTNDQSMQYLDGAGTTPVAAAAAAAAANIAQPPHGPPQAPLINPCMQYPYKNSSSYELSGSEVHSPSNSSASTALGRVPDFSVDELNNNNNNFPLDSSLSGRCTDEGYGLIDAIDLAPASASSVGYSASDWNIANNSDIGEHHSLWSMDELWHIRKLYEWGGN